MIFILLATFSLTISSDIPEENKGSRTTNPAVYFETPVKQVACEGSYVTLSIGLGGDPFPTPRSVEWTKKMSGVLPNPSSDKKSLTFKGVLRINSGDYLVYVDTDAGVRIVKSTLEVRQECMSVDVIPKTSKRLQGTVVEIQCSAGALNSQYMWLRDGKQLSDDTRFSTETFTDKSVLKIKRIKHEDAGTYECRSWNDVKAGNNTASIVVQSAGDIPTLYIQPVNKTFYMSEVFNIDLRCYIPSDPRAQFTAWKKDGQQILANERRVYDADRSKLSIFGIQVSDSGTYTCVATLSNGVVVQNSTKVTVRPAITITCTEDQFLEIGDEAVISCSTKGDSTTKFEKWMRGSSTLENDDKYTISGDNAQLTINNIEPDDGGTYLVIVHTSIGTKHQASSITVIVDAKIEQSPSSLKVATGSDVYFSCRYSGTPIPYFIWMKDTKSIQVEEDRVTQDVVEVSNKIRENVLTMKRVTKADAGSYVGYAHNMGNHNGAESRPAKLEVIDPPVIDTPPQNVSLIEGKSTVIRCGYTGDEPLFVEWLYNGSPLSLNNRIEINTKGSLRFSSTLRSDTGSYTCKITNQVAGVEATATLDVLVPPIITTKPQPVNVSKGSSVKLTCAATIGYPEPFINWRVNGKAIKGTFKKLSVYGAGASPSSDTLEVVDIKETRRYSCTASNKAGSVVSEAIVAVKTVPEKPGLPIAVKREINSILLRWDPGHDGYSPIIHYTVQYKMEDGGWTPYPETSKKNELMIKGLKANRAYFFRVYSRNEVGDSEASSEARISTEQGVPSAPLSLNAKPLTSTSAMVSWDIPTDTQGSLLGYELTYQPRGSVKLEVISTTTNKYELKNLEKFKEYSVRVLARNSKGTGDSTPTVIFRTLEDKPSSPVKLKAEAVSSSSVRVDWVQPLEPNGDIQYYTVYYQCTTKSMCNLESKQVQSLAQNPRAGLVDLLKYTEYMVYVTATTNAGEGARSANVVIKTNEDVPCEPPRVVRGEAVSSTSIMVSWEPPARTCGVIRRYKILYKILHGGEEMSSVEVTTISQHPIESLSKYTKYQIQVQAASKMGFGPLSEPIYTVTGEDIPEGRPVNLKTNAWSSTEITLLWRPPPTLTVHGKITGYVVEYKLVAENVPQVLETGPDEVNAVLENLAKGQLYEICVKVKNSKGVGPCATETQLTSPDLPGAPFVFEHRASQRSIEIHWEKPVKPNGKITGYKILYGPFVLGQSWHSFDNITVEAGVDRYRISNLQPWTQYQVKVAARTSAGYGNYSDATTIRTMEDKPASSLQSLSGEPINTTHVKLTWNTPKYPNGVITSYHFTSIPTNGDMPISWDILADVARTKTDPNTFVSISPEFKENTLYKIKGRARNKIDYSDWCEAVNVKTTVGSPVNVHVLPLSDKTAYISWESPQGISQGTSDYFYMVEMDDEEQTRVLSENVEGNTTFIMAKQLTRYLKYSVRVRAVAMNGTSQIPGPWTDPYSFTQSFSNPISGDKVEVAVDTPGSVSVIMTDFIPSVLWRPGLMVNVLLVDASETSNSKEKRSTYSSNDATLASIPAEELANKEGEPTSFSNDRTKAGGTFQLMFEVAKRSGDVLFVSDPTLPFVVAPTPKEEEPEEVTEEDPGKSKGPDAKLFLFAIIPIILILVVVMIVIIVKRQRQGKSHRHGMEAQPMLTTEIHLDKTQKSQYYTSSCHPPIPLSELLTKYETLASNDFEGLIKEFDSIEMSAMYTYNDANAPENSLKNRFSDVVPYDYNRVKLEGAGFSDYINASYIDGFNRKREYIATQGPTPETIAAFWRMVWEQRTATIVMVTRLIEDEKILKCHQYWPQRSTQQRFGDLTVSCLDEVVLSDFTVRKFSLAAGSNGFVNIREIIQFQFTAWPDHGIPQYATASLAFLRKVQLTDPENAGPIVVHCSTGVGRTGTFIVIDTMLRRLAKERDVDVFGCVSSLRTQRMQMVQTVDQYKFIYMALLEAIHCGNTEMRPNDIANRLESMSFVDNENNSCGMEIEFKRLAVHYKYSPNLFTSANLPVNQSKNRYANVLPFEGTRVILNQVQGKEGSDYINASYITGYQRRNAFIATQGPLEETVQDFWRMIWEQNVNMVVMLTQIVECGRPGVSKCYEYWPTDRAIKLNNFTITLRLTNETQSFTRRELSLFNNVTGEERIVLHFHFDAWPEQGLPQTSSILALVFQVLKISSQRGQDHAPLVVHCSAGGGRTGVFIAISIAIERFLQEKLIDIFSIVKNLRNQRPAMVQTMEQYRFIYQVMAEYVESSLDNVGYY